MHKNRVLQKLKKGECVNVVNLGFFPCSSLVELVGRIGFDCAWLDMEHRSFGLKELAEMALACRTTGMEPLVRVVKGRYTGMMKPLETGATGLMIPHCLSTEEARQVVNWAKYPPQGRRGFDNAGPDADYTMADRTEYMIHSNRETFLVAQIEDQEAVDRVEEIASVDGIDVLFIGPADLSLSYGIPFQFEHPTLKKAIERVRDAAAAQGKWWGTPFGSIEEGKWLVENGARFLAHGADVLAIKDGFLRYRKTFELICSNGKINYDVING